VAVEIAEAVISALRGDLAATAVNAPMVPVEVLSLPRKELFVVPFLYDYAICLHLNSSYLPTGFIRVISLCCPC
jgi:hypothetical protein